MNPPPPHGPPPYGFPPYGPQPYGPSWQPAPRTNSLAIASLIVALVSLVTCPLFGLVAVVLGVKGRGQVIERDEAGSGMALAGIIVGGIATILGIVIGILYAGFFAVLMTSGAMTAGSGGPSVNYPPPTMAGPATGGTRTTATTVPGAPVTAECRGLRTALNRLTAPRFTSARSLNESARTLQVALPPSVRTDIELVLVDALGRTGPASPGTLPSDIVRARANLSNELDRICPP